MNEEDDYFVGWAISAGVEGLFHLGGCWILTAFVCRNLDSAQRTLQRL